MKKPIKTVPENIQNREKLRRKHRQTVIFNDMEFAAFERYCKKYKIRNRAKFMREAIVTTILKKFDQDYPTLFDMKEIEQVKES